MKLVLYGAHTPPGVNSASVTASAPPGGLFAATVADLYFSFHISLPR